MSVPKYKLYYFNIRARAEPARMVLAQAGVEYEDVRMTGEEWTKYKNECPTGQAPWLVIDGKTSIGQSMSIARYLAKEYGLMGKDNLEGAQIDMTVDTIGDLVEPIIKWLFEKDETRKADMKKKYAEETMPFILGRLEKLLVANNGGNGFFVGDKVSLADTTFICQVEWLGKIVDEDAWAKQFPQLAKLKTRVEALPKIAEWIKNRPKTDM